MTASTLTLNSIDFATLYERSHKRAYNLAYKLTGNAADAEDVTQDAYVRALVNFASYDQTRSFEGWLFRIITNRVIDMRRRQKRVPMYSLDAPAGSDDEGNAFQHEFADPDSNPEDLVVGAMMDDKLEAALAALPPEYREAVMLCDVEEKSYDEIAQKMQCAVGTVRSRIHRGRVMLRRILETGVRPRTRKRRAVAPAPPASSLPLAA